MRVMKVFAGWRTGVSSLVEFHLEHHRDSEGSCWSWMLARLVKLSQRPVRASSLKKVDHYLDFTNRGLLSQTGN